MLALAPAALCAVALPTAVLRSPGLAVMDRSWGPLDRRRYGLCISIGGVSFFPL